MSREKALHPIRESIEILVSELRHLKSHGDHWTGQLSTSALSTATAVSALAVCREQIGHKRHPTMGLVESKYRPDVWDQMIERGSHWLSQSQNQDGGFGDTDRSLSNIATTWLAIAAWKLAGHSGRYAEQVAKAQQFVDSHGSWEGLRRRYGKDKTFVVPIMLNCALAKLVSWDEIPTLPFEAAALPQSWYRLAQLPVVSYAIPALVAIGQAQFVHNPPNNIVLRWLRSTCRSRTSRVLQRMQPLSGGYLEAVPLTSFVLMSLASIGQAESPVAIEARKFIIDSVLEDGSWPIDTNLATWVTSLASVPYYRQVQSVSDRDRSSLMQQWNQTIDWILSCQHVERHPFTGADPGGWGWTDLSGAVPDADDTPAALLALRNWMDFQVRFTNDCELDENRETMERRERTTHAAAMGVRWLLSLQNRDGGWPTFCRGWGTLPFDRSGCDLTAHAIRALAAWREFPANVQHNSRSIAKTQIDRALSRGTLYLQKNQRTDGSWLPLWFGNQDRIEEDNPVYGTGRVLLCSAFVQPEQRSMFNLGLQYLMNVQNPDGSWGGGSSTRYHSDVGRPSAGCGTIEETAIALEGIMEETNTINAEEPILRGLNWLCESIQLGYYHTSQPIGFYFARLWYYEKLYPLVFSLSALNKGLQFCQR